MPSNKSKLPSVLILTESAQERSGGHGPALRYWGAALQALASHDIDLAFGTLGDITPVHRVADEAGFNSFAFRCRSKYDYPRAIWTLRRMMYQADIRIAHLSEPIPVTLGLIASRKRRISTIFHRHHTVLPTVNQWVGKKASRRASQTIAVSDAVRRSALSEGAASEKVVVVHNGIQDLVATRAGDAGIRESLSIPRDALVVAVLGRLRPEKGHDVLFNAWASSSKATERHLLVIGDGPQWGHLTEKIQKLGLSQVHLVGHQDNIGAWLHSADVVVVPSTEEPFGIVAIEAMSLSKPLIASRTGGLQEIVEDGVTGFLIEPGSVPELSKALDQLPDKAELSRLGVTGRKRFEERFTIEAMVTGWIDVWSSLIN